MSTKKPAVDLSSIVAASAPAPPPEKKEEETNDATQAPPPRQDPAGERPRRTAKRSTSLTQAAAAARKQTSPKFVQLRGDQQIELDILARELQAARTTKQERITANTVIRVAVDAILAHRDALVGDTEEELRTNYLQYLKSLEEQDSSSSRGRKP
jgi:hypothetical protein